MTRFYSYLWLRQDGTPYYAGKGTRGRAFTSGAHGVHRPKDCSRILIFPMVSEAEAFESEIALIDLFGRKDLGTGCLRNLTNGSEGACGVVPSEVARQRISQSLKGRVFSAEHRCKLSEAGRRRIKTKAQLDHLAKVRYTCGFKGVHSEETRQKMRESSKHRWETTPASEETRRRISTALMGNTYRRGKPTKDETKRKQSDAHKRIGIPLATQRKMQEGSRRWWQINTHSAESRQKISEAAKGNTRRRGKTHSDEARQKMRDAWKRRKNQNPVCVPIA